MEKIYNYMCVLPASYWLMLEGKNGNGLNFKCDLHLRVALCYYWKSIVSELADTWILKTIIFAWPNAVQTWHILVQFTKSILNEWISFRNSLTPSLYKLALSGYCTLSKKVYTLYCLTVFTLPFRPSVPVHLLQFSPDGQYFSSVGKVFFLFFTLLLSSSENFCSFH